MHTVLSLQRMSRRDARQPRPPWSSLTLRRRTSDERAASGARVSRRSASASERVRDVAAEKFYADWNEFDADLDKWEAERAARMRLMAKRHKAQQRVFEAKHPGKR